MRSSVEQVLEQQLGRVTAPAELWDRVEIPREPRRRPVPPVALRWSAVAAVAVLALGLGWRMSRHIRTANAMEIQSWVQKQTGVRVPLDLNPPSVTQLSGARLAGPGSEIAFTAAAVPVVLRVEPSSQRFAGHGQLSPNSTSSSWVFEGQRYTLETSSPQALQAACRLCHG